MGDNVECLLPTPVACMARKWPVLPVSAKREKVGG